MPSYHSVFNKKEADTKYCGILVLDFKKNKSPSLDISKLNVPLESIELDIIDEAIIYFRANVLFKNYSIDGDADKLIVYITVFIQKCLEKTDMNTEPNTAKANMKKLVDSCEYIPNTENFFNVLVDKKQNEIPNLQKYLKEIRKEVVDRLIFILYENEKSAMDRKFWLALGKKKFMGYDMLSSK